MLIPLDPSWSEILTFSAMGFCVVMCVLALMSLMTSFVGLFFTTADKIKANTANKQKSATKEVAKAENADIPADHAYVISAAVASVMPDISEDSGRLLAVISAAATVALGDEVRVVAFKPVDATYSRFGREQIFRSQNYTPFRNR